MTGRELQRYTEAVTAAKNLASRSSIVTPVRFKVSTENGRTRIACPTCGAWKLSTPPTDGRPESFLHRDPSCHTLRELQQTWRDFLLEDGVVRA
jgi:hypothetical protein